MSAAANHLRGEVSPYLAAHASDPVDWHPWNKGTHTLARELDRPVSFLSVGYQSCHWCHVMQRESFRDPDTASFVNTFFVPVKVDRELRPDIDALYMSYVALSQGSGGWPLTVVFTPDLLPFFGGTYFPKNAPGNMVSFQDILAATAQTWADSRGSIIESAAETRELLSHVMGVHPVAGLPQRLALAAAEHVLLHCDLAEGGPIGAPKFPQFPVIDYLLSLYETEADERFLETARHWVNAMLRGGIYDQVGGGLFRYSTDSRWLVPHFEKMLYDSALLLSTIARLHRISPSPELARVARQTAGFLRRDLARHDAHGQFAGFYSSLDAETLGAEGATYVWSYDELSSVLDPEELAAAEQHLGVTPAGNWQGTTILTRREDRTADTESVDAVLAKLLHARAARPQPAVITNVLTEWNALAARGLLEAGFALREPRLTALGLQTLDWLVANAIEGSTVRHAVGDPSVEGLELLGDFASVTAALIAASKLAGRENLLPLAEALLEATLDRFGSPQGLLFETTSDTELPVRPVNWNDAPLPSGTSTTAENLAELRPDDELERRHMLSTLAWAMIDAPMMAGNALRVSLR